MLVAKPDKKTEHMASLVSRQRNNREGYNVRTGQVLQAFGVPESNGQESEKSTRKVPKHLLSQIKELVNLRGALPLGNLFGVYEEEFGYRLEFKTLGFTCLEDLFTSDPEACALFRLQSEPHGWMLCLKEKFFEDYISFKRGVLVPKAIQVLRLFYKWKHRMCTEYAQESLRNLLVARPQGVALSSLPLIFSQ